MKYSENSLNILTILTYKGIGKAWINKNIYGNENLDEILLLLNNSSKENNIITTESFNKRKEYIKQKILEKEESIDGIIAIGDNNFPKYRGEVKQSEQPVVIFYKGNIDLLSIENHNIAVIGLLEPENNTIIREQEIIKELVSNNITIISGLAFGCDSVAHQQTLDSGGKTVAILPSTLNNIFPSKNKNLAENIIKKNGLVISEYYEEPKSQNELISRYQERDRLQALYSDYIILISSYSKNNLGNDSGSRLAMGYALNYGIKRAVMYDINTDELNPKFDLNRQIINEDKNVTIIDNLYKINEIISNNSTNKMEQTSFF